MAYAVIGNNRGPRGLPGPKGAEFYLGPAGEFNPINSLNNLANGYVTVSDYINATYLGLPEAYGGVVLNLNTSANIAQQQYSTSHPDGAHIWTRVKSSGSWSSWSRVDAGRPPRLIQGGSDLNTFYGDAFIGSWRVTSTATADTILNLPLDSLGRKTTTVIDVTGPYGFQTARVYNFTGTPLMYYRARTTFDNTKVNAWTDWYSLMGGGSSSPLLNVGQDNKALVDAFLQARGGSIGTAGIAAVALRFDHNLANFRDIVLPLLRARSLPWSVAVNTAQNHINAPANGGVTFPQIQGWALNYGGEVLAHSHTHADSTSTSAIVANVEDSLPILKTGAPQLVVEGFAVPGVGGTEWEGWTSTNTPEHFTSKYVAASAVMKNFAFCTGYISGAIRPLMGTVTNGQTHVTMDSVTNGATVIGTLQQAQQLGAGVQLMMHPNMLTLTDGISPAVLTEILDWIVVERDAGRIVVLTTSGLVVADARHAYRQSILRPFGSDVWTGTSGWTFSGTTATGTSGAGIMSGSVVLSTLGHVRGRPRELVIDARSAAGAVLSMGVTGQSALSAARNITLPSDNAWRTYRVPFTVPASGTSLTVNLGRVSGGALEIRTPAIRSI